MEQGYLYIETSESHPGLLRVLGANRKPRPPEQHSDPEVRYIARYRDLQVGQMHAHCALRRKLVDIDQHLYRGDIVEAIAAVEADNVWHERAYLDPELEAQSGAQIGCEVKRRQLRQQRVQRLFDLIGKGALGLLIANLLVLTVT
jgi:hypothetical protein